MTLTEFWASRHLARDPIYLSTSGPDVMHSLGIDGMDLHGLTVLNIGVGLGGFELWASPQVASIDCLDIVAEALPAVAPVVHTFYLTPELLPSNTYDLITERYVAQHLDDATLSLHMEHAIRALRPSGLYAVNVPDFLHAPSPRDLALSGSMQGCTSGSVRRTVRDVADMVYECGGRICAALPISEHPQWNSLQLAYHIRRIS